MEQVVKQSGRFALVQSEEGFAWVLTGGAGGPWYWHPEAGQWTGHPRASPTPEAATAGLTDRLDGAATARRPARAAPPSEVWH
jgi:hypothetical protein